MAAVFFVAGFFAGFAAVILAAGFFVATGFTFVDCLAVVLTLTGDLLLTALANLSTRWLRLLPVRRLDVFFFGLPNLYLLLSD